MDRGQSYWDDVGRSYVERVYTVYKYQGRIRFSERERERERERESETERERESERERDLIGITGTSQGLMAGLHSIIVQYNSTMWLCDNVHSIIIQYNT